MICVNCFLTEKLGQVEMAMVNLVIHREYHLILIITCGAEILLLMVIACCSLDTVDLAMINSVGIVVLMFFGDPTISGIPL